MRYIRYSVYNLRYRIYNVRIRTHLIGMLVWIRILSLNAKALKILISITVTAWRAAKGCPSCSSRGCNEMRSGGVVAIMAKAMPRSQILSAVVALLLTYWGLLCNSCTKTLRRNKIYSGYSSKGESNFFYDGSYEPYLRYTIPLMLLNISSHPRQPNNDTLVLITFVNAWRWRFLWMEGTAVSLYSRCPESVEVLFKFNYWGLHLQVMARTTYYYLFYCEYHLFSALPERFTMA